MRSRELQIPGVELDGVLKAIDFLLNVNLGYHVELGDDVVVVGGGNVALDAARSALREIAAGTAGSFDAGHMAEAEAVGAVATATLDVARTAMRLGARRVRCVMLENRAEMPANEFEIEEAEVEGIELLHRLGPNRIVGTEHVEGLETLDVASVFDADGRFNPSFVDGTEDTIGVRLGDPRHRSDRRPLLAGTRRRRRGHARATPSSSTARRSRPRPPGVYSGGDLAFGPRNLIDAIADGRRAAASIHRQLTGEEAPRPSLAGRTMLPIVSVTRGPKQEAYTERSRLPVPVRADRPADRFARGRARLHRGGGSARGRPVPPVLPEHHARTLALHPVRRLRRHLSRALHPDRAGRRHRRARAPSAPRAC